MCLNKLALSYKYLINKKKKKKPAISVHRLSANSNKMALIDKKS